MSDTVGHLKMVIVGIVVFTLASIACGLTPTGPAAAAWIITLRVIQGIGGAFMYPAALAIVVAAFPVRERGRAMAIFFGVAGGLTSIGPILGGYLSEWTWRAIFWVNVPVAIIALILTFLARPHTQIRPGRLDWNGLVLIAAGVGLSVFGLQQTQVWGWADATTIVCMVAGVLLLVAFFCYEMGRQEPLIDVRTFRIRAFRVQNIMLFISMIVLHPDLLLRQHLRAGLARRRPPGSRSLPARVLPRLRARRAGRRAAAGQVAARRASWWAAA